MLKLVKFTAAGLTVAMMGIATSGTVNAWGTQQRGHVQNGKAVACYKKVRSADQYRTVKRRILVQPESSHVEVIPAQYSIHKRRVLVRPQQVSWHETAPEYAVRKRRVQIHPQTVSYRKTPAEYTTRTRRVLVSRARKIAHTTPARYRSVYKKVMVSAAHTGWTIKHDRYGKPVHCQVEYPATYENSCAQAVDRSRSNNLPNYPGRVSARGANCDDPPGPASQSGPPCPIQTDTRASDGSRRTPP